MSRADLLLLAEMRESCTSGVARALRQAARLTQREIGAACTVSGQTIALWETGKRNPTGSPALTYAKLLRQLARQAG